MRLNPSVFQPFDGGALFEPVALQLQSQAGYQSDGVLVSLQPDALLKNIYSRAAFGMNVHIFDTEQAYKKLPEAEMSKKKYMLITQEPVTLLNLINSKAINPHKINVGPMSKNELRNNIVMGIYANEEEINAFKVMNDLGIEIEFQLLPESNLRKFSDLKIK